MHWSSDVVRTLLVKKHVLRPSLGELPLDQDALLEWMRAHDPYAFVFPEPETRGPYWGGFLIDAPDHQLLVPLANGLLQEHDISMPLRLSTRTKLKEGVVVGRSVVTGELISRKFVITEDRADISHVPATAVLYEAGDQDILRVYSFVPALTFSVAQRLLKNRKRKHKPAVLDFRYCSGGDVRETVDFSSLWFDRESELARVVYPDGRERRLITYPQRSTEDAASTEVWVSQYTASSCELMLLGLRYHRKVKIVGEATRGKCSLQSNFNLRSGHRVRFTTGGFLGPGRVQCHGSGIEPDVQVFGNIHMDSTFLITQP